MPGTCRGTGRVSQCVLGPVGAPGGVSGLWAGLRRGLTASRPPGLRSGGGVPGTRAGTRQGNRRRRGGGQGGRSRAGHLASGTDGSGEGLANSGGAALVDGCGRQEIGKCPCDECPIGKASDSPRTLDGRTPCHTPSVEDPRTISPLRPLSADRAAPRRTGRRGLGPRPRAPGQNPGPSRRSAQRQGRLDLPEDGVKNASFIASFIVKNLPPSL